jgi:hypothetical protein
MNDRDKCLIELLEVLGKRLDRIEVSQSKLSTYFMFLSIVAVCILLKVFFE